MSTFAKTNEQNNRDDSFETRHFDEGRPCGEPPCTLLVRQSRMLMQQRPLFEQWKKNLNKTGLIRLYWVQCSLLKKYSVVKHTIEQYTVIKWSECKFKWYTIDSRKTWTECSFSDARISIAWSSIETRMHSIRDYAIARMTLERFSYDLEKWFRYSVHYLFHKWKDQNMDSSFSRHKKP